MVGKIGAVVLKMGGSLIFILTLSCVIFLRVFGVCVSVCVCVCVCVFVCLFIYTTSIGIISVSQEEPSLVTSHQ